MTQSPPPPTTDERIRVLVASHVARTSVFATAALLGVSRAALTSYIAGRARAGSVLLIETKVTMLLTAAEAEEGETAEESETP